MGGSIARLGLEDSGDVLSDFRVSNTLLDHFANLGKFASCEQKDDALPDNSSCVGSLFFSGSPSHVSWFVVAIIVWKSVKAMVHRRSWPYVFEERLKGIPPSLAYLDSSTSVATVVDASSVMTALLHAAPNPVLGRLPHAMYCAIHADTPAGLCDSVTKRLIMNGFHSTAITNALHHPVSV